MNSPILIWIAMLISGAAWADCIAPIGVAGQLQWMSSLTKMQYCNGSSWIDTASAAGTGCIGTPAGTFSYSASDLIYCDGIDWKSMKGPALTSCSGTTSGTFLFDSGTSKLKFCDGTTWYDMTAAAGSTFYWTGATGDGKWSTTGNWSGNAVPTSTDIAHFQAAYCSGSNCNVNIDSAANVLGIDMSASYTGTITQGSGITITVGSSGWVQSTGTFVGSNADIVVDNSFTLTGGTFTPSSANLKIVATSGANYTVFSQSGGTYNAGSGTLYFAMSSAGCVSGTTYTIDVNSTLTVNHLRYAGGHPSAGNNCTWEMGAGDSLTANGNAVIQRDQASGTIACTGTLNVKGNFTVNTGANGGTLATNLTGTGSQTVSHSGGTWPSGNFSINKSSGIAYFATSVAFNSANFYLTAGSLERFNVNFSGIANFSMGANTTFRDKGGSFNLTGSTSIDSTSILEACWSGSGSYGPGSITWGSLKVNISGTLTLTSSVSLSGDLIVLSGNTLSNPSGYTISSSGNVNNSGTISNSSGVFSFSKDLINTGTFSGGASSLTFGQNWNNTGTFTAGTSTVTLNGTTASISGSTTFYNLTKTNGSTLTFASGSTQTITNTLNLKGTSLTSRLSLLSNTPGTQWNINAQGSRSLSLLDVKDSNNTNGTAMAANDSSLDSGNNTNWTFVSATADKKIFLTSTTYSGNLGGVSGADSSCSTRATAGGLSGVFKAWIAVTTGTNDPNTTFLKSAVPYKMVGGATVANDWAGLTSGSILAEVNIDEFGNTIAGTEKRLTNVTTSGTASSSGSSNTQNCTGFTSANGGRDSRYGTAGATNSTWTDNGSTTTACNGTFRLICVQQY